MKPKTPVALAISLAGLAGTHAQTTFTQVTNGPVATDIGAFIGAAWGDFRNTGLLDLFAANWNVQTNVFYLNDGDETFTKVTGRNPVIDADDHVGAAMGDYDNDGNLDLFVSAGVLSPTAKRCQLYHNDGGGIFSAVSGGVVTNQLGFFGPCAFADYDNDGFLDLFVANHGDSFSDGGKNILFHNNGDGTFTRITTGAIVNDIGAAFLALWADYDNDGFEDLVVINNILSNTHNFLYHNNRNGTFTHVSTGPVATDTWSAGAFNATWGDYDNDGWLDLFVTDNAGIRNHLYHNNGDGTFSNVNSGPMLSPPVGARQAAGCAWGDYDNDGYLDLYVTYYGATNGLYHNNGNGTFTQVLSGALVQQSNVLSATWVDYDNDGFLDLFVTGGEGGRSAPRPGPYHNLLFHNGGNTNAWLEVKCIGTVANRSAIGTKVRARATVNGKTVWQLRELTDGQPFVAHFGLGDATNVDTLRIEWPSGTVQEIQNVSARQILTITEPPRLRAAASNGVPQFFVRGGRFMEYDIQSSTDLMGWSLLGTLTITNLNGTAEINDTNPPGAERRFFRALSH